MFPELPDTCLLVLPDPITISPGIGDQGNMARLPITYMITLLQRKQLVQGQRASLALELDSLVISMDFSGTLARGLDGLS